MAVSVSHIVPLPPGKRGFPILGETGDWARDRFTLYGPVRLSFDIATHLMLGPPILAALYFALEERKRVQKNRKVPQRGLSRPGGPDRGSGARSLRISYAARFSPDTRRRSWLRRMRSQRFRIVS